MTQPMPPAPAGPHRFRVLYARGAALRFISHQDEFRMWERAIRRTRLPLAYKQGYNPQPHMQFAAPLGVGFSGQRELMDFRLETAAAPETVQARLARAMPPGVVIRAVQAMPLKTPALQSLLFGADYALRVDAPQLTDGPARVDHFLSRAEIWRTRQRKGRLYQYNLRPLVHALACRGVVAGLWEFRLRVQMLEGATGRPDEVLDELGLSDCPHVLQRQRLYFASQLADLATFAAYVLASRERIAGPAAPRRAAARRRAAPAATSQAGAQAFARKAADEFR